ncbi:ABC transporter ATP-binding protein [Tepidanaerobacter acetatoxydans]|uniref:ABC transporter ATP-binding protein n=1 Tax=Tepidanaerobacter acetatoxydans TaxID=499229 RepID=UPI001BD40DA0|nr:ABC transporter ATP-binding protein [Tepidanaerobacter acetatoxydans]
MEPKYKLIAQDITKVYEGESGEKTIAIKNLNLQVKDGEFLCLVGPSGCGKTTLIKILAGLLLPTSGSILMDGKNVTGKPSKERGVVFQENAVFPWMTVEQNVEYGPKVNGLPKTVIKEISSKYIKLVNLSGFEKALPKELSGGMKKRVDIARAYANNPDILLMDEPFGSLDSQTRSKMQMELLQIWQSEKKTVIFITHDLEEAIYLADRVIMLTARPSYVFEEMIVPIGRPRDKSIKTASEFVKLRADLENLMEKAIELNENKYKKLEEGAYIS